ncbi:MAG TPA: hypothetical protein VMK84_14455 [Streptosporangiaceae bacterium]|nr:hypothetical protein [Streptosporangiaceae bacterium]
MRYRLMATYLGVPYHAGLGPDGNEVTLFSPAPPPDELGFTAASGHWRKQVSVTDLDALWQSRLAGEYQGEPCLVLDDLGDRLHIAYLGRDSVRARQLGYWEIDREVFEVVVVREDITGLAEERVDYPLDAAMFPASHRDPVAQARPEGAARGGAAAAERTSPLRMVPQPGPQQEPQPEPQPSTPDRMAAWHGSPEAEPWPGPQQPPRLGPRRAGGERRGTPAPSAQPPGRRSGRRDRVPQSVFAELLSLAAIPHAAYAVDEEVPGAMCLVKADGGFEVFSRTDDARLDVRFFEDEEAAYFYLFGVLAAEAVRSGRLRPGSLNGHANGSHERRVPSPSPAGNVSKYLRPEKLPTSVPRAVIVN